jgi:hypothetical protein
MSLCGASSRGLLASRVNRGCEGSNDCVEAEGFPLSAIEKKVAKGSPLNHSSTAVKRPVQEWLLALL